MAGNVDEQRAVVFNDNKERGGGSGGAVWGGQAIISHPTANGKEDHRSRHGEIHLFIFSRDLKETTGTIV